MFKIVAAFIALAIFQGACAAPLFGVVPNASAGEVQTDATAAGTSQTANTILKEYFPNMFGLTSRADDNIVGVQAGDSASPAGVGLSDDVTDGLPFVGGSGSGGSSDTGLGLGGLLGTLGGLTGGLGSSSSTSGLGGLDPLSSLPIGGGALSGISGITGGLGGVTGGLPGASSLSDVTGLVSEGTSIV